MNLHDLNPMQRLAAETTEGPLLIIAGAGSGKTRAMTYRIANLLQKGVPAYAILALTFTNKAAREMLSRVDKLSGQSAQDAWIGTFHSICVRILRRDIEKIGYKRSFVIYDDDDQQRLLKDIYKHLNLDDKLIPPREVRSIISDAKNRLLGANEWFARSARDFRSQRIHDIFREYDVRLKKANALDFDDLISATLQLLVDHPPVLDYYRSRFRYIHVDEYQDTNFAQYSLVRLLSEKSRNLCVVGDDDQSIYGWRGADIRNILEFKKDFPDAQIIKLEQNYRSTANILDAANQVIAHNQGRMEKTLWTDGQEGEKIRLFAAGDEREEASWVCEHIRQLRARGVSLGNMAVLYRMHALSRVLEEMLMRAGIPYRVYGGTRFYDRREIKDVIAYLRLMVNPADVIALKRIINVPKRSIGDTTVAALEAQAQRLDVPLWSVLSDPPASLSARARKSVNEFMGMMNQLTAMREGMPLVEFAQLMITRSGLLEEYGQATDEETLSRKENILEFVGAVQEFQDKTTDANLEGFLENVALVTELDQQAEAPQHVTLMTLHSAKGLEFDAVFMTGLEEGVFPSFRCLQEDGRLEEERRLCYVGMTRARKELFLSYARRRMLFNQLSMNPPSGFVGEVPPRLLDGLNQQPERRPTFEQRSASAFAPRRPVMIPAKPSVGGRLDGIPGVQKGFVPSAAREAAAPASVFQPGDRVLHRKFGEGVVREISGRGAQERIVIDFGALGEKQFAMSVAPIVRLE